MSTQTKQSGAVPVETSPENGEVTVTQAASPAPAINVTAFDINFMPQVDAAALAAAPKQGLNLSIIYHSFEMGVEERGLFLGCLPYRCVNQISGEEEILTGAVWVDPTGQGKICCAVKFVSAIAGLPAGTAFVAVFNKTKKTSSGGNMQLFDIRKLDYRTAA